MKDRLQLIHELIDYYELTKVNRQRFYIYKRYYLMNELRALQLNLMQIGEIFGKNHATIIHGLRNHADLMSYQDPEYIAETNVLREALEGSIYVPIERKRKIKGYDLRQDILDATNFRDVKRIQRRIKIGLYEKYKDQMQLFSN